MISRLSSAKRPFDQLIDITVTLIVRLIAMGALKVVARCSSTKITSDVAAAVSREEVKAEPHAGNRARPADRHGHDK
jgi:hypothetical protein